MPARPSSSSPDTSWHLPLLDVIEKGLDLLKKTAATPGIAESGAAAAFLAGPWATAIVLPVVIALRFHSQRTKDHKSSAQSKRARLALLDPVKAVYEMLESDPAELQRLITGDGIDTTTPLLILFNHLRQNGGKLDGLEGDLAAARVSLHEIKVALKSPDYRLSNLESSLRQDFRTGFESLRKDVLIETSNLPDALRPSFKKLHASLGSSLEELKALQHVAIDEGRQRGKVLDKVAKKLEVDPDSVVLTPAALDGYAAALQLRYRTPELLAIRQTADAAPFSLTDIFIEPRLRLLFRPDPRALELPEEEQKELQQQLDAEGTRFSEKDLESARAAFRGHAPVPAFEHLETWEMPGQLLFSGAGGGKSALLQYLALRWATVWAETRDHEKAGPVPLLIELRRYAAAYLQDHTLDFEKFIATSREFPAPLPAPAIVAALAEGRVRLLLDGLDEVLDPRLRRDIARLALGHIGKDRPVLLTTRIFGFDPQPWADQPALDAHLIPAFEPDQRDAFIERALVLLAPDPLRREDLDRGLRQRLQTLPHFRELADNPLLLTLLVLVTANHATIETRADLYEEASKLLLDQWETQRFRQGEFPAPFSIEPLQYSTRRNILGHLAWTQLHRPADQPVNLFPLADIKAAIRSGAAALSPASLEYHLVHLPELLRQRHNVLCFRGGEQFSFVHRTFLEYFAALHLHNLATEEELSASDLYRAHIRPHLRDERWQEPLRLYFSLTDKTKVAKLTAALLAEIEPDVKLRDKLTNSPPLLLAAEAFHDTRQETRPAELARQIAEHAAGFLSRYEVAESTDFLNSQAATHSYNRLVRALVKLDIFLGEPFLRWRRKSVRRGEYGGASVYAVLKLGEFLSHDPDLRSFLFEILQDKDSHDHVRHSAASSLFQLHGQGTDFHAVLANIIHDKAEDEWLRWQSMDLMDALQGDSKEFHSLVREIVGDKGNPEQLRARATECLARHRKQHPDLKRFFEELVGDEAESRLVRLWAQKALEE